MSVQAFMANMLLRWQFKRRSQGPIRVPAIRHIVNRMADRYPPQLSGGQRQRVAIARVLLKNAPILIMDEATSALDSEVESAIQENLEVLMEGKTVIAIAHRLSTIAAMDRLIVMDDGKIIEQGSHYELLQLGGVYAQLWKHQTGGFLSEQGDAQLQVI